MSYQVMDERFMLNEEPLEGASEALSNAKVLVYTTMGATEARRKYGVGAQSIAESLPCAVWEDGIRDVERSRGLGDVYKRQRIHDDGRY